MTIVPDQQVESLVRTLVEHFEAIGGILGPLEHMQLTALDDAGLATLLARIKAERRWP